MNKEKVSQIIGQIDEKYINEAEKVLNFNDKDTVRISRLSFLAATVLTVVLAFSCVLTIYGAIEKKRDKDIVPSENPWQTIHKTDPEKDDEGETTDKYRTVKLLAIDFNGDGTAENVEIQEVTEEESLPVYILRAEGSGKNMLDYSLGCTHPHWNSFSLCREGDESYILGYCPYTNQGISAYSFELYAYSDAEGFYIKDSMSVRFDRNGKEKLPVDEMVSFAERLNGYLMKSEILISTLDGKTLEEGRLPEEVYSWADEYVKGEGLSLTEKLTKCSEIIYDNYHK